MVIVRYRTRQGGPVDDQPGASDNVSERVEGLMLGADDYLPKPFDMRELAARLRALGRRSQRARAVRPVLTDSISPSTS